MSPEQHGRGARSRAAVGLRRRLRYLAPEELRRRWRYVVRRRKARTVVPVRQASVLNVFHCCVQRTASQWLRHLLADWRVYRHAGLRQVHPADVDPALRRGPLTERTSSHRFPPHTIASPLYIAADGFEALPKVEPWRAFFVYRDPRDITVSWYFSARYSHTTRGTRLAELRRRLDDVSISEGLVESIRFLDQLGLYAALASWIEAPAAETTVLVRYEDLTGPESARSLGELLAHCDIALPDAALRSLLADHSFEAMSGRERGDENPYRHLRKGVPGDWRQYFDDRVGQAFDAVTGDLVSRLGYPVA